jgi:UDP-glucose 4-epimerase
VTEGSVLDPVALDRTFAGCDVVFHEAARASVAESLVAPRMVMDVNAGGSIEVMLAAHRAGVRRVVFAGSSAVYGVPESLPCRETQRTDPISPYGVSKLAAEHLVHALGKLHGVETVVLRYFNVYGPGQDPEAEYAAVVPRFITAVLGGRAPVINGTDDISRDFVNVRDVVTANLLAAGSSGPSELTCNIASGVGTSLRALLDAIGRAAGRAIEPRFGPARPGDIRHSVAEVSLARDALRFSTLVTLDEGIAEAVASFGQDGPVGDEARPARRA